MTSFMIKLYARDIVITRRLKLNFIPLINLSVRGTNSTGLNILHGVLVSYIAKKRQV